MGFKFWKSEDVAEIKRESPLAPLAKVFSKIYKKNEIIEEVIEPSLYMKGISFVMAQPLLCFVIIYVLGYILLRLKLLSKPIARYALKLYLPLTYFRLIFLPPFDGLWSWIGEDIMIGVAPFGFIVPHLVRLNVRGVVNVGEFTGARWPTSVEVLTRTTRKMPNEEDLRDAVKFIHRQIESGNRVYIYDKAGTDRAGLVMLAWLAHKYHYELERNGIENGLANLFRLYLAPERRSIPSSIVKQPTLIAFANRLPLFSESSDTISGGTEETKSSNAKSYWPWSSSSN